jgi:hypothetical protein
MWLKRPAATLRCRRHRQSRRRHQTDQVARQAAVGVARLAVVAALAAQRAGCNTARSATSWRAARHTHAASSSVLPRRFWRRRCLRPAWRASSLHTSSSLSPSSSGRSGAAVSGPRHWRTTCQISRAAHGSDYIRTQLPTVAEAATSQQGGTAGALPDATQRTAPGRQVSPTSMMASTRTALCLGHGARRCGSTTAARRRAAVYVRCLSARRPLPCLHPRLCRVRAFPQSARVSARLTPIASLLRMPTA